jgi:hypothetical protein
MHLSPTKGLVVAIVMRNSVYLQESTKNSSEIALCTPVRKAVIQWNVCSYPINPG